MWLAGVHRLTQRFVGTTSRTIIPVELFFFLYMLECSLECHIVNHRQRKNEGAQTRAQEKTIERKPLPSQPY